MTVQAAQRAWLNAQSAYTAQLWGGGEGFWSHNPPVVWLNKKLLIIFFVCDMNFADVVWVYL